MNFINNPFIYLSIILLLSNCSLKSTIAVFEPKENNGRWLTGWYGSVIFQKSFSNISIQYEAFGDSRNLNYSTIDLHFSNNGVQTINVSNIIVNHSINGTQSITEIDVEHSTAYYINGNLKLDQQTHVFFTYFYRTNFGTLPDGSEIKARLQGASATHRLEAL